MEFVGDRLTFREDVAQVLCAENIPDDDNNDCGNDDDVAEVLCAKNIPDDDNNHCGNNDDVTKVLCSKNIPDKKNGIVPVRNL